jgi:DNA-binding GntR family transcriptional regulator
VAPLRRRDIEELRSLSTVIERYAAHLMIERLTDADLAQLEQLYQCMCLAANRADMEALDEADLDIHTLICELSGHALLFEVWRLYATRFRRVLALRNSANRDLHAVADMHLPLIDSLRRRDRAGLDAFYDRHGADLSSVLTATWPELIDVMDALRSNAKGDPS